MLRYPSDFEALSYVEIFARGRSPSGYFSRRVSLKLTVNSLSCHCTSSIYERSTEYSCSMIPKTMKWTKRGGIFGKVPERQVACIFDPCVSHRFSLFLLPSPLPLPPSLSFALTGATCAPKNSSFISRVLCSAAAVRLKKFLS